jgi:hypothetical protein
MGKFRPFLCIITTVKMYSILRTCLKTNTLFTFGVTLKFHQGQGVLVQQLQRYRSESSLDELGRPDPPTNAARDQVETAPSNGEQRRKSKDKKTAQPAEASESVVTNEPVRTTEPTRTAQTTRTTDSARMSEK